MSTQYAFGKIVTDSLIVHIDAADRNSYVSGSSIINDLSTNFYTGSLFRTLYSSDNGGSIAFNATSGSLQFPTNSINLSTGNFTIEFWVKKTGANTPFSRYFQTVNGDVFGSISVINSGSTDSHGIQISTTTANGSWNLFNAGVGTLVSGSWNHVVITRSGSTFTFYVNTSGSVFLTSAGTLYNPASYVPVVGGQTVGSIPRSVHAQIPVFRVYRGKALSQAEIIQNYNAQKGRFGLG